MTLLIDEEIFDVWATHINEKFKVPAPYLLELRNKARIITEEEFEKFDREIEQACPRFSKPCYKIHEKLKGEGQ